MMATTTTIMMMTMMMVSRDVWLSATDHYIFSFRLPHTWPDVEEHMFEMSVIVINVIDVFGSVSRLAWAVGKRLGAILGCPGAILGRFGSVLEPS